MNKFFNLLFVTVLLLSGCAAPANTPAATELASITPSPSLPPTQTATPSATPTLAPTATATATATPIPASIDEVTAFEMKGAFDFFWEKANTTSGSPGYGLIRDREPGSEGIASMASVGFGLSAYAVGVEKGYITRQEGYDRANQTMDTLLAMDRMEGFYYHFVDLQTGKRAWESEISSIDSTILFMGVLTAGQYFGGDVETKARKIFNGVNWPWFIDPDRNMFYMAYRPEKGFEGHWDFYAEQLMMYVLAAGSDTHPVDDSPYYTFTRHKAAYGDGKPFIHSWFGSIFTYQFSHAWIDFRGLTDKEGVNWFDNSVNATLAQINYATDKQKKYKTLGPNSWGLSACDSPDGYNGTYGAPPSGFDNNSHSVDDTLPPYGAIGSILFAPEQAKSAMIHYYSFEKLKGKYGFKDAYNLSKNWFDTDVIGIDKGVSLLMLANAENDIVYKIVMNNKTILNGLKRLKINQNQ